MVDSNQVIGIKWLTSPPRTNRLREPEFDSQVEPEFNVVGGLPLRGVLPSRAGGLTPKQKMVDHKVHIQSKATKQNETCYAL